MSAEFKNIKKKASQAKLRHLLNEHKSKRITARIDSPLAKYNDLGQLTCLLCQFIVRTESLWSVHINSKQHKEKLEKAKSLKNKLNNISVSQKRPITPPTEVPAKKLKSILKNPTTTNTQPPVNFEQTENVLDKTVKNKIINNKVTEETMEIETEVSTIPEGFFDDPKEDAKARHIEYKDPIDEEWERFQKAIKDADNISAAIIAEDQEEATNERQIDEIDEQLKNWSRVLNLERKKTEVIPVINKEATDVEEISDEDENFDEYLDWRSKSFKL